MLTLVQVSQQTEVCRQFRQLRFQTVRLQRWWHRMMAFRAKLVALGEGQWEAFERELDEQQRRGWAQRGVAGQ